MLHPMLVTGHPIAPRPPRSLASLRRKERLQRSAWCAFGPIGDARHVRMCAPAKPDRRDRIDFEGTLSWYDAEDRLIICNRAYGDLVYPALGMPYERGHPQRSEQGLVEDPKGRQEERVYRRIAGSAALGRALDTNQRRKTAETPSRRSQLRPSRKPRPESCKPK